MFIRHTNNQPNAFATNDTPSTSLDLEEGDDDIESLWDFVDNTSPLTPRLKSLMNKYSNRFLFASSSQDTLSTNNFSAPSLNQPLVLTIHFTSLRTKDSSAHSINCVEQQIEICQNENGVEWISLCQDSDPMNQWTLDNNPSSIIWVDDFSFHSKYFEDLQRELFQFSISSSDSGLAEIFWWERWRTKVVIWFSASVVFTER